MQQDTYTVLSRIFIWRRLFRGWNISLCWTSGCTMWFMLEGVISPKFQRTVLYRMSWVGCTYIWRTELLRAYLPWLTPSLSLYFLYPFFSNSVLVWTPTCCPQCTPVHLRRSMEERRRLLERNVTPIKSRIMLSEQTLVTRPEQLQDLMGTAIRQGLEGLVLKDLKVMGRHFVVTM